jgi:large subunit ribosomal protein L4
MAGRRQGTASTLRRDEVAGSALRFAARREQVVHVRATSACLTCAAAALFTDPKPRDYAQDTPRKMRQAAFRTALNSRLQNDALFLLDGLNMSAPKTKELVALLGTMQFSGKKLLLLVSDADSNLTLSARNIPKVVVQSVNQTGLVDVLRSEVVLCTRSAWDELSERIDGKSSTRNEGSAAGNSAEVAG